VPERRGPFADRRRRCLFSAVARPVLRGPSASAEERVVGGPSSRASARNCGRALWRQLRRRVYGRVSCVVRV